MCVFTYKKKNINVLVNIYYIFFMTISEIFCEYSFYCAFLI